MITEYSTIRYMLGPGTTIDAVLKLHNSMLMTEDELRYLRVVFTKINDTNPPIVGQGALIPILKKYKKV